ncbi:MAG: hypothetical protein FJ255_12720 [Phycisphaerae bacterium]|nr:hypothetical protein [Phycisphaerae bacterium]
MTIKTLIAAGLLAAAGSVANAAVTFSFADPAPGKQLRHTSNGGAPGSGTLSYDQSNTTGVIRFIVGSNDGSIPTTVFSNARMEMSIDMGTAIPIAGGFMAPLMGTFRIYDFSSALDILTGTFGQGGGTAVVFGASGALITNSIAPNALVYTAGPALQALLPTGLVLAPLFDAVFTITDIAQIGGGPFVNTAGEVASFDANASFSGTSELIPTPGTLALLGAAGLVGIRRRR